MVGIEPVLPIDADTVEFKDPLVATILKTVFSSVFK